MYLEIKQKDIRKSQIIVYCNKLIQITKVKNYWNSGKLCVTDHFLYRVKNIIRDRRGKSNRKKNSSSSQLFVPRNVTKKSASCHKDVYSTSFGVLVNTTHNIFFWTAYWQELQKLMKTTRKKIFVGSRCFPFSFDSMTNFKHAKHFCVLPFKLRVPEFPFHHDSRT